MRHAVAMAAVWAISIGVAIADAMPTVSIQVGNLQRHFLVYAPPGLPAHAPLLMAFHPSDSSGLGMRGMVGATLERMAREKHFLLLYPDGFERHFDDCRRQAPYRAHTLHIDDVGFTRAMVEKAAHDYAIDSHRVYALGYSNGAQMVLRLALEAPDLVAGVVAVAGNLPVQENLDCSVHEDGKPNLIMIEGTEDPINPYQGGEVSLLGLASRGNVLSAADSARWFARRYGLPMDPNTEPPLHYQDMTARIERWGASSPRVVLISIIGGGHTVPQAEFHFPAVVGRTFADPGPLEAAWTALQP